MLQTCMGCDGMLLTLILWSLSVLTMYWLSGLTVRLVIMLQKWPRNSGGAWTQAALLCTVSQILGRHVLDTSTTAD